MFSEYFFIFKRIFSFHTDRKRARLTRICRCTFLFVFLATLVPSSTFAETDTTSPTNVAIVSPKNGTMISGTSVKFVASASDNVGVTKVEYWRSSAFFPIGQGTKTIWGWVFTWNSTTTPDGIYSFTAKAYDAAGNSTISPPITLTVENVSPGKILTSQLPLLLGNYYGYNSTIFCSDSLVTAFDNANKRWRQYFIYSDVNKQPYITARTVPNRTWEPPINLKVALGNLDMWHDSHNCLAAGVDPEGYIHVSGNQHNVSLHMARSTQPHTIANFVNVSTMVNSTEEAQVTYPNFFETKTGDLMFLYRNGVAGSTGEWYLNRWDSSTGTPGRWVRVVHLTASGGQSFYPWHIAVDRTTSFTRGRIHIFGTWRQTSGYETNEDLLHFFSDDDGKTWKQYGSLTTLTTPISFNSGLRVLDTQQPPNSRYILNNGGLEVDSKGNPHALVLMSTTNGTNIPRLHHIWHDADGWHTQALDTLGNNPRSSIVTDTKGNVFGFLSPNIGMNQMRMVDLTPGSPTYGTQVFQLANDFHFRLLNAVFDTRSLYERGELSFMVTQVGGEPTLATYYSDENWKQTGFVLTLDLDDIEKARQGLLTLPGLDMIETKSMSTLTSVTSTPVELVTSSYIKTSDYGGRPLFARMTIQGRALSSSTLNVRVAKMQTGGMKTVVGLLPFTQTSFSTYQSPWLPIRYLFTEGTLSAEAIAGGNGGEVSSAKLEVGVFSLNE